MSTNNDESRQSDRFEEMGRKGANAMAFWMVNLLALMLFFLVVVMVFTLWNRPPNPHSTNLTLTAFAFTMAVLWLGFIREYRSTADPKYALITFNLTCLMLLMFVTFVLTLSRQLPHCP